MSDCPSYNEEQQPKNGRGDPYRSSIIDMIARPALCILPYSLLLMLLLFPFASSGAESLHSGWTELLRRHVHDGAVDYQGFKQDEARLDDYLAQLAAASPDQFSEAEQLAFWINGYNAYTVKLILDHFKNGAPPSSIRKIGGLFSSPWKIAFAEMGGSTYTLDNIEHDIIRVNFNEPRIHFAVNCASKSCPILISEAYQGEFLDRQLETSTRNFLENPAYNYLAGDTLHVSSIFKWYGEDFDDDPLSFFLAHTEGALHRQLSGRKEQIRIKYLDYDWSLNGTAE